MKPHERQSLAWAGKGAVLHFVQPESPSPGKSRPCVQCGGWGCSLEGRFVGGRVIEYTSTSTGLV